MSAALTYVAGRVFAGEAACWAVATSGAAAGSTNRNTRRPSIAFIADSFVRLNFQSGMRLACQLTDNLYLLSSVCNPPAVLSQVVTEKVKQRSLWIHIHNMHLAIHHTVLNQEGFFVAQRRIQRLFHSLLIPGSFRLWYCLYIVTSTDWLPPAGCQAANLAGLTEGIRQDDYEPTIASI